jgi:RNA polymerase sigma factor (sigma-70 family)
MRGDVPSRAAGQSANCAEAPAPFEHPSRRWYADHGPAVYRYLRFQLPTADDTEDLTAETFLRVVRASERFSPELASARTWIFRIARNVLRDYYRAKRLRRHVGLGALRDLAIDAPSVEERLLWEEQVASLLLGLDTLSVDDRELLSLRYGSDLSAAEIGDLIGAREAAVRTRVWRALARLRKVVASPGGEG